MDLVKSIVARLLPSRNAGSISLKKKPGTAAHLDLGRRGEDFAAAYLKQNGYKVLYRNFRGPKGGEVDIICRDKAEKKLVFVEVKTRTSEEYGRPITAVDHAKQVFIARGALAWLRMLDDPEVGFRFDVVEVVMEEEHPVITLVQDAFVLPAPYRY